MIEDKLQQSAKTQATNDNPLVAIVVITYNSSEYILETLESVKAQTYQNIELIVSDDCSTDDTVEICSNWIEQNKERFIGTELIRVEKNTGVSPNINRGNRAATGQWIKVLSGDDTLFPESIQEYVSFIIATNCRVCYGKMKCFGSKDDVKLIFKRQVHLDESCIDLKKDLGHQKRTTSRRFMVYGPGMFYSRDLFYEVGGLPEQYPFADEWPFSTNVILAGNKVFLLDKYLYGYRVQQNSLTIEGGGVSRALRDTKKYFYKEALPRLLKKGDFFYAWNRWIDILHASIYHKHGVTSQISKCARLIFLLSPVHWLLRIKKILRKIILK